MDEKIAVLGLGYVGLPLALALARRGLPTIGFDVNEKKLNLLEKGIDPTEEGHEDELKNTSLRYTSSVQDLKGCTFFIVAVPTPIDENNNPDLSPLRAACDTVGQAIAKGGAVVFESTVYPGVTEEICGPLIEKRSGLARQDFKLGYSPERINPGDKEHSLEKIVKVVAGEDAATLDRVARVYESVVDAGVFRAASIKTAEAAKVIENTQRDLNIALMNELAIIFDRMNISTKQVLETAGTKWNFLRFSPGLVGGHCIGVDPYYLTTKAQQLGYNPQVILAGRRINDGMGSFIGQRLVKLMINAGLPIKGSRVGVLGLTFKENVSDLRNSRVPDILKELREFGVEVAVHDPLAEPEMARHEYGIELSDWSEMRDLSAVVLAVAHAEYLRMGPRELCAGLKKGGIVMDVKSVLDRTGLPEGSRYWSL
jgi:UDP-N-acetyl-D-glucosamine/UDP-N-acetyl-D-galactosamine dehydrogenase